MKPIDKLFAHLEGDRSERLDMANSDLSNSDLGGEDLTNINFSGANFSNCYLIAAKFSNCDLRGSNFEGAKLGASKLTNLQIMKANFHAADLMNADLSNSELTSTDFSEASLIDANLYGTNLRKANLSKAVLWGTNCEKADLSECNFQNAYFTDCSLRNINFTSVNLKGALFSGESDLTGARFTREQFESLFNKLPNNPQIDNPRVSNVSGYQYQISSIKIGTQEWACKNLDVSTFRNGDEILEARTEEEWVKAGERKQPTWCYNYNNIGNGAKYGKLYNWYAVNDKRGLAPNDWHVPSDDEWTILINYLGERVSGTKMKSTAGWKDNGNGNNESGFDGLPGGNRLKGGAFGDIEVFGYFWSSTQLDIDKAWYRILLYSFGHVSRYDYDKNGGFSVRCVKD